MESPTDESQTDDDILLPPVGPGIVRGTVVYFFDEAPDDTIDQEEWAEAIIETCEHLRTFFRDFFAQNLEVEFISLDCGTVATFSDASNGEARVVLDLDIQLGEGKELVPLEALFSIFFTAMNPPANEDAVILLQALGEDNIFSTTVSTTLEEDLDSGSLPTGRMAGGDMLVHDKSKKETSNNSLVVAMLVVSIITALSMLGVYYIRAKRSDEISRMIASQVDSMSASLQSYSVSSKGSSKKSRSSGQLFSGTKSAISSVYEYSVPAGGYYLNDDDDEEESEILFIEDERSNSEDRDRGSDGEDEDDSVFSRPFRVNL